MKKSRIIALVAATVLSVSVLAGCGEKKDAGKFKDGKYEVESKNADERGYKSNLVVEVKDGKIASATYDEVSDKGGKKADKEYNTKMKEIGKKTNPSEAFPALEKALVEKQDAAVDSVSGATSSSDSFKKLAKVAVENAAAGKTEKALVE